MNTSNFFWGTQQLRTKTNMLLDLTYELQDAIAFLDGVKEAQEIGLGNKVAELIQFSEDWVDEIDGYVEDLK